MISNMVDGDARPRWAPQDIDVDLPSAARMYDYYLGGSHNFAADRRVAEAALAVMPEGRRLAQINRAFLRRAVRFCVELGIRQFVDVGSGIPTLGNVHEVAQGAAADARVVYVDLDAVAVAHSRQILAGNDRATVLHEDLRRPDRVLGHPELLALLDLDQPVALLALSVLHFVNDADDPVRILREFRDAFAPGSLLVISHATDENRPDDVAKVIELYKNTAHPLRTRDRDEVFALFAGWELLAPGLVWAPLWRPESPGSVDEHPELSGIWAGVARKA
jgi:SAM-dependent methyltransferase